MLEQLVSTRVHGTPVPNRTDENDNDKLTISGVFKDVVGVQMYGA